MKKIRFVFQVFPFCYLSVQSIWSIYSKVSLDIALKDCKIYFCKSAIHWPKLDIECALWSKVRFWGKSHFFKKKSRIPKNMQSYEISFWEIKTDTLGHLLRQHYFWKNWNMKIIFQKSGFLRKKQCFSACKMTLKAYSYFICRNILILLRMVLN